MDRWRRENNTTNSNNNNTNNNNNNNQTSNNNTDTTLTIPKCTIPIGRPSEPLLSGTTMSTLINNNTQFAVDLYKNLDTGDENVFFSPLSLSISLAMTYAGAARDTAEQMKDALHFGLNKSVIHSAFEQYADRVIQDNNNNQYSTLSIVNSLWGRQGYTFRQEFLDILANNYNTCVREVDFVRNADKYREMINEWVSNETNDMISDMLPEGSLKSNTVLVLVNAIYFKGKWELPFQSSSTRSETFTLIDGSDINVQMLHRAPAFYSYYYDNDYEAVTLKYAGGYLAMTVILPNSGKFSNVVNRLSSSEITKILNNRTELFINVALPKFQAESEFSVVDALKKLGMTDAFGNRADFSLMNGRRNLYISDIFHAAVVTVDEVGTEAVAMAAAMVAPDRTIDVGPQAYDFTVNRPFIFFIHDQNDAILFMGHMKRP